MVGNHQTSTLNWSFGIPGRCFLFLTLTKEDKEEMIQFDSILFSTWLPVLVIIYNMFVCLMVFPMFRLGDFENIVVGSIYFHTCHIWKLHREHTPGIIKHIKPPNDSGIPNHKLLIGGRFGYVVRGMLENS